VAYRITHRFYRDHLAKEFTVTSPQALAVRIVEPFVNDVGTVFTAASPRRVTIQPAGGPAWALEVTASPAGGTLALGTDAAKYWCPFPAVECYPVTLEFSTTANEPARVQLTFGPR
jgi:hypothetical protein